MKSRWDSPNTAKTIEQYWESLDEVALINFISKWIGPQKGLLLDAGCGSARISQLLEVDEYIGIDGSEEMLSLARIRTKKDPHIKLIKGDICDLPFPDHSVPSVLCMQVFRHLPDYKPALKELCRVVKERLFITDMFCFGSSKFGKETVGVQIFDNNVWSIDSILEDIESWLPGSKVSRHPFNNNIVGLKVEV